MSLTVVHACWYAASRSGWIRLTASPFQQEAPVRESRRPGERLSCGSVLAEIENVLPAKRRVGRHIFFEPNVDISALAHQVSSAEMYLRKKSTGSRPFHAAVLLGGPDERRVHDQDHAAAKGGQGVAQDGSPAQVLIEHVPQEDAIGFRGITCQGGDLVAAGRRIVVDAPIAARGPEALEIGRAAAPVLD